ncbi:MAG: CRISPR-associated endonuclease Cas2 [Leptolyngbyaceae cyanobacterium SL_1_1]|nr:CRISPR-associated endonuclease Cas2 [Leptolyngbyaceae cyanobacterium RM1_1_2]NJO12066.1 CRISPR-associated endonuclease Cas2 [Leptolyngbyaceae cyanobacterium SL_1_1]
MLTLVVYDIADNRRRTKLAKLLEGYGRRVQESVFECFLSLEEMKGLHEKVMRRIQADEDNVRFYWIPPGAVAKSLAIGSEPPAPPQQAYFL